MEVSAEGENRRFWVGFNKVHGIGPSRLEKLILAFGDIADAWNAPTAELEKAGLGRRYVKELVNTRAELDLDKEMKEIEKAGFHVVTWDDSNYPRRLREISAPPPVLYVWGEIKPGDRWASAIVGTRRPTAYGRTVTQELATALAVSGVTVVSGLARGIDGLSHNTTLEAGGRTLAILGSGLDQIYPPEHRNLAERIAAGGAVVSDYPMGTRPEGKNFPPRNRIISGLSLAVVIVEAGEGSGALITADYAAEQGRDLYAVPGSIYSRASRGTNSLIQAGARSLTSVDDLLEGLNLELIARHERAGEELPEDEKERSVFEALANDPIHVDEIQVKCGLPVSDVTVALAMLELKGRVRQVGGMQYVRAREPRAGYRIE